MSDRRRKYSTSSDDSYEREKRKKSKHHHKEHKKKHKKDKRDEKRSSHDRKKYYRDHDRYDKKYHERRDREKEYNDKYKSKQSKDEKYGLEEKKSFASETKKIEILQSMPVSQLTCDVKTDDKPSTSTNNDITLPSYYNSSIVNAQKFAEQQKKRKLLWQGKKTEEPAQQWTNLKFSQDNDGTKANKFMRLMGIKETKEDTTSQTTKAPCTVQKSDDMLQVMQEQYEIARNITHLSRGVGLGFK